MANGSPLHLVTPDGVIALGIPTMTNKAVLRRLAVAGKFPPGVVVKLNDGPYGRWLFNVEKLLDWIEAGGHLAAPAPAEAVATGRRR